MGRVRLDRSLEFGETDSRVSPHNLSISLACPFGPGSPLQVRCSRGLRSGLSASIPHAKEPLNERRRLAVFIRRGQGTHLRALTATDEDGRLEPADSDVRPTQYGRLRRWFILRKGPPARAKSGRGIISSASILIDATIPGRSRTLAKTS
jgi:hypothetical protein